MSYFDHFATSPMTAGGRWIVRGILRREYAILRKSLQDRRAAILEIGPGRGELAEILREDGFLNYTGVEPNALMRDMLVEQGFRMKSYMIPQLEEPDASYDVVFLSDVFEHLNDTAEAKLFISEVARVLRTDGLICIGCPDYLHWGVDFFNGDYSHANITTERRTRQLFMNYGLRTVSCTYMSGFVSGPAATLLSTLVRAGLCFVHATQNEEKLYKLKLTFLRRFFIVGAK